MCDARPRETQVRRKSVRRNGHGSEHNPPWAIATFGARIPRRGSTFVEILIVVVIGILATVTVMAIRRTTDRAAENSCDDERKSLQTAHEAILVQEQTDTVAATGAGLDRFEQSFIEVGILREVSSNSEMEADGILTPQAGGVCS